MKRRYPQLCEQDTVRAHRAIAPKFPTLSTDVRGPFRRICEFDTLFFPPYFPVFDTLNAIRALRAGWQKQYPFYAFLFTRMMYRPQWDMPPPPPPPSREQSEVGRDRWLILHIDNPICPALPWVMKQKKMNTRFSNCRLPVVPSDLSNISSNQTHRPNFTSRHHRHVQKLLFLSSFFISSGLYPVFLFLLLLELVFLPAHRFSHTVAEDLCRASAVVHVWVVL